MVTFNGNRRPGSTLGGTGLAVSAFSRQTSWAIRFAGWVVSPQIQSTLYVQHGGQPGHRQGWTNEAANDITHHYFRNTLDALDRAYVRPRYHGYLYFQDHAGIPLQQYLMGEGTPDSVLEQMNRLYQQSKQSIKS
jgi:multiple sugar transport system substrate-binding protein